MKPILILSATLCLTMLSDYGLPIDQVLPAAAELQLDQATVRVFEHEGDDARRIYDFSTGEQVVFGRSHAPAGSVVEEITLPEGDCTIRRWENATWTETPLQPGIYDTATSEILLEDGTVVFCYVPEAYVAQPRNSLIRQEESGYLEVEQTGNGWTLSLVTGPVPEDGFSDYTLMVCRQSVLDYFHENSPGNWYNYTQDGEGRWCYDGYYRTTPENYDPTGENHIYRCPASYVVMSMAEAAAESSGAATLATAMAHTLTTVQNSHGYWETGPISAWLWGDYGIGEGFFDSRFNSDLALMYATLYNVTGGDYIEDAMERYCDYYLDFATSHHWETASGGWMVQDYTDGTDHRPTHTALNHQAAAVLSLYHLSDILQRPEIRELCDRMVLAIEDTASSWVREDHNLHYSVSPDGQYGGTDYPALTYNDLLALNAYLKDSRGQGSAAMQFLMDEKRIWMDANGVTNYHRLPEELP